MSGGTEETYSRRRSVGNLVVDGTGGDGAPTYMTLSKMMTLLSSVPGDREVRDLMSGAMYSR